MTSTFPDISLSTDRLLLRAFEEDDLAMLAELGGDDLVSGWLSSPLPRTAEEAREWALRHCPERRAAGEGITFAAVEFLTGRLVGFVTLQDPDWRCRNVRISFATGSWARGEGYAPEALLAVVQWLFEDQKFARVELRTAAGNASAQQVAQKVGCISEGVLRSASLLRGGAPQQADAGLRHESSTAGEARTDVLVWSLLPEDLEGLQEAQEPDGLTRGTFDMWD